MTRIVLLIAIVFALVGCGTTVHPKSAPINSPDYHIEFVPYHGHILVCVIKQVGTGNNSWGGPSCDWNLYHHQNGYH